MQAGMNGSAPVLKDGSVMQGVLDVFTNYTGVAEHVSTALGRLNTSMHLDRNRTEPRRANLSAQELEFGEMVNFVDTYASQVKDVTSRLGDLIVDKLRGSVHRAASQAAELAAERIETHLVGVEPMSKALLTRTIDSKNRLLKFADSSMDNASMNLTSFDEILQDTLVSHIGEWSNATQMMSTIIDTGMTALREAGQHNLSRQVNRTASAMLDGSRYAPSLELARLAVMNISQQQADVSKQLSKMKEALAEGKKASRSTAKSFEHVFDALPTGVVSTFAGKLSDDAKEKLAHRFDLVRAKVDQVVFNLQRASEELMSGLTEALQTLEPVLPKPVKLHKRRDFVPLPSWG